MALPASLKRALSVSRQATGSYVAGTWTPGAPTTVTTMACVMPDSNDNPTQEQLNRFGVESLSGGVRVYSDDQLYPVTATAEGDRFSWNGKTYEIYEEFPWQYLSLAHWAYRARLITSTVN